MKYLMNSTKPKILVAYICVSSVASAIVGVDFTLSLDSNVDSGLTYNDLTKAGAGVDSSFVVGFQLEITAVDGQAVNIGPIAAFCAEIAEPVSVSSFNYDLSDIAQLSAGTAGQAGTASSNIPTGGIGDLRAARLAYLFDNFYISDSLSAWTMTDTDPTLHAFQLAVWEITHDDDLSLSSGSIALGTQTGGTNVTRRTNASNLATSYLNTVAAASIDSSYTSSQFAFWSLTNVTGDGSGSGGYQDLILALELETPQEEQFTEVIPEPSAYSLLVGLVGCSLIGLRRRR